MSEDRSCAACGEPLPARARFCLRCGRAVDDVALAATLPRAESDPPLPPRVLAPGTRLGSAYRIEHVVGEGGMGVVYRATDEALGRAVAIKALHSNLLGDAGIRRRFAREADVMRRWQHPNAVAVYDFVEAEALLAIVMEYVEGGHTLEHHLEDWGGPLPWDDVQLVFDGVLDAMEHAHSHGVVHRDLKPQNILLRPTEAGLDPKVADFGIAKVLEGTKYTVTGALLGTTHYMSPEQVTAPERVDARSDVYALGATLYRAVTGRMPFESDSHYAVMMAQVSQEPTAPSKIRPGIPEELERLLVDALAKDPADRPQSCGLMRARLADALATVSRGPRERPEVRREPVLVDSDGHELLLVPAGKFQMGPSRREVYLDAFYIGRHPVTNAQFARFLEVTGYEPEDAQRHRFLSHWRGRACPDRLRDHPVVFVSQDDARAYAAWAGRRLPSEAEWEKAARGTDGRRYPWGRAEPTAERAHYGGAARGTVPVTACPEGASPCGALGMAGNVWEWCEDVDDPAFYLKGPPRNPRLTAGARDAPRVVRGGSFMYDKRSLRTFARSSFEPWFRLDGVGFRCAMA